MSMLTTISNTTLWNRTNTNVQQKTYNKHSTTISKLSN